MNILWRGPSGHHQQSHVQQVAGEKGQESRGSPTGTGARHSPVGSASSGQVVANLPKVVSDATLKRISDIAVTTMGLDKVVSTVTKQQQQQRHRSTSNCDLMVGTFMWGATGEQPWDATLTIGVDWKSIIWPACLPITFTSTISCYYSYVSSPHNRTTSNLFKLINGQFTESLLSLKNRMLTNLTLRIQNSRSC